MKLMTMITVTALLQITLVGSAFAKDAVCTVKTNDIGTIYGHGSDSSKAFEDAAVQCVDRYSLLRKARGPGSVGADLDEDTKAAWIDACANLKCQI